MCHRQHHNARGATAESILQCICKVDAAARHFQRRHSSSSGSRRNSARKHVCSLLLLTLVRLLVQVLVLLWMWVACWLLDMLLHVSMAAACHSMLIRQS